MPIKAIIFDLGGVFTQGSSNLKTLFAEHGIKLAEDLWKHKDSAEWIVQLSTGVYGPGAQGIETFFKKMQKAGLLQQEASLLAFTKAWRGSPRKLYFELIDAIQNLRTCLHN